MNFPLIANIVVFVVLLFALAQTRHKQWSLAKKVLVGLVMGVVFGLALHTIYGSDSQVLKDSVQWFNIVGNGYVQLLQMIVMYSAAIFLIPICISFDTAEKRRYATYLILNRRFSFEF